MKRRWRLGICLITLVGVFFLNVPAGADQLEGGLAACSRGDYAACRSVVSKDEAIPSPVDVVHLGNQWATAPRAAIGAGVARALYRKRSNLSF
jgi:hypothetical protein